LEQLNSAAKRRANAAVRPTPATPICITTVKVVITSEKEHKSTAQTISRCLPVKRLVSFPLETGGAVLIEVEEDASGAPATRGLHPGDLIHTVGKSFEAALEAVNPAVVALVSKLRNFLDAPDIEIEFGLKFGGEAGAFIASASTEAQFRVKMVWKGKPTT
jgi:Trypsin-co-occurring domain 1